MKLRVRPRYPLQFLISVLAAFLLWYGLAAQRGRDISVRGVRAQITLVNIPSDLVLVSGVPDSVATNGSCPAPKGDARRLPRFRSPPHVEELARHAGQGVA